MPSYILGRIKIIPCLSSNIFEKLGREGGRVFKLFFYIFLFFETKLMKNGGGKGCMRGKKV